MDKAQAVALMKSWFTERFDEVVKAKWSDELTSWVECIVHDHSDTNGNGEPEEQRTGDTGDDCRTGHYTEPPIPVVVGFLTQIIVNYETVANPGSPPGAVALALAGHAVAPFGPVKTCDHTEAPHIYNKIL